MKQTDPHSLVHGMRITLPSAVAWRVMAELMRRHGKAHDIKILQVHPGISIRGCYYVLFDAHPTRVDDALSLVLNLGGPAGTYRVKSKDGRADGPEQDFLFSMLGNDPVRVLDQIDKDLGLRAPKKLPPSTPAMLVARTIAACLEHAALSPLHMRTTAAYVDASAYGPHIAAWARHFVPASTEFESHIERGSMPYQKAYAVLWPYMALHLGETPGDMALSPEYEARPLALFDFKTGQVQLRIKGKRGVRFSLPDEYAKRGHTLDAICLRILRHLGVRW